MVKVISQSKDGKRAQIVRVEPDANGVMTSRTHHVVNYKGQWQKDKVVNVNGKDITNVEVFE